MKHSRLPSREELVAFIRERSGKVGTREIARAFGAKNADRAALSDLVHRYAAGVDDRQFDSVAKLFTDTAELEDAARSQYTRWRRTLGRIAGKSEWALHVYRGPMTQCAVFRREDGNWYTRDERQLSLDAMH